MKSLKMNKKRILYVMPDNPMGTKAGNITRTLGLLTYFQGNKDILDVEFVSYLLWDEQSEELFKDRFPDIKLHVYSRKFPKDNLLKYFFLGKIPLLIYNFNRNESINEIKPYLKNKINKLHKERNFDIAIMSYAKTGKIVENWPGVYKILDTHDFLTSQQLIANQIKINQIGNTFQEEIDILNLFDDVWTYSSEEHFLFEQFTKANVKLFPVSTKQIERNNSIKAKYPVLYVASDNEHNVKSMNWFITEVLPLIPNVEIFVVGKICNKIPALEGIIKLGMIDNLNEVYQQAKITICPMLSGTGVKIKVLESLSYGLPVVTTRRGVDGLINKTQNGCLVASSPEIYANFIIDLLENEVFYSKISREGLAYFNGNHHEKLEEKFLNNIFLT